MVDSAAALVDGQLRPPRQGDSDEGRALLLDAPVPTAGRRCWRWARCSSAGSTGGRQVPPDAGSSLIGALARARRRGRRQAGPAAIPVRGRRGDPPADRRAGLSRDLVPLRRRPARFPRHRRARPRRRPVGRGPLRRASTSWPIRARTATTASPPGAPTSGRRSRTTPSSSAAGASQPRAVRSSGCVMRRPGRSSSSMTVISPAGRPNTTDTPRSIHRRGIAARSCWTGPRAASISSTRSTAAATRSDWPSTSGPRYMRNSTNPARSWAGLPPLSLGRRGWNCRRGCGGACIGARLTPSSAGTHLAWVGAFPPSRSWVAAGACPGCR